MINSWVQLNFPWCMLKPEMKIIPNLWHLIYGTRFIWKWSNEGKLDMLKKSHKIMAPPMMENSLSNGKSPRLDSESTRNIRHGWRLCNECLHTLWREWYLPTYRHKWRFKSQEIKCIKLLRSWQLKIKKLTHTNNSEQLCNHLWYPTKWPSCSFFSRNIISKTEQHAPMAGTK